MITNDDSDICFVNVLINNKTTTIIEQIFFFFFDKFVCCNHLFMKLVNQHEKIIMPPTVRNLLATYIYPLWRKRYDGEDAFLNRKEIEPFFRIMLDYCNEPPKLNVKEWVDLLRPVAVILMSEELVIAQMTKEEIKQMFLALSKLGTDIAGLCGNPLYLPKMDHVDTVCIFENVAKQAMLISYHCLHKLYQMQQKIEDVIQPLSYLVKHVKTRVHGHSLIHILCEPHNLCKVPFDDKLFTDFLEKRLGEDVYYSLNKNDIGALIYPCIPNLSDIEFAVNMGGAKVDSIGKDGKSTTDILLQWIADNMGKNKQFFSEHRKGLVNLTRYLLQSGATLSDSLIQTKQALMNFGVKKKR